jgi:glucose-1-phosphate adenylyltransferase
VKDVLCLILGGGKGSRLFPLTLIRSKPAVPVAGKYRLVDIPISNCINSDINRIFVLTQYNSESLNRHINQTYRFGLFSRGFVDILAAEQTPESAGWYQGTADAVRQSLHHIRNYHPDHVLILSGDHLYRMNYKELYDYHCERDADVTLSVIPVTRPQASGLGILKMRKNLQINEFHEKPEKASELDSLMVDGSTMAKAGVTEKKPFMASMGIYLFKYSVLEDVLAENKEMDFGRDIIPSCIGSKNVFGYIFDDYWEDIGTINAFYKSNLKLAARRPRFNFYDQEAPIYSHPRFLPSSRVEKCDIEQAIISEGCVLHESVIRNSVIGIRSFIRKGAKVVDTLMMGADYYDDHASRQIPLGIGEGSEVRGAILDKNARIGSGVTILNKNNLTYYDGDNYYIRDKIVIIPKNAVIQNGTVI